MTPILSEPFYITLGPTEKSDEPVKISETLTAEINDVTEADCIEYIRNLIINRTYEGYHNEVKTIYEYLENILRIKIYPAPDKWDRLYNVDFYLRTPNRLIGFQIKPLTYEQLPEIHKWRKWLERTHEKFKKDKGGEVFIIFTTTKDRKKVIYNQEVIEQIRELLS